MLDTSRVWGLDQFSPTNILGVACKSSRPHEGHHAGIIFVGEDGTFKLLHLAWHNQLVQESFCLLKDFYDYYWSETSLHNHVKEGVVSLCEAILESYLDGKMPYGFSNPESAIDPNTGKLNNTVIGLTCATFVAAVFDSRQCTIIDLKSWGGGNLKEDEFYKKIVRIMRNYDHDQYENINNDPNIIGSRISPLHILSAGTNKLNNEVPCQSDVLAGVESILFKIPELRNA